MIRDLLYTAATGGAVLLTGVWGPAAIAAASVDPTYADPFISAWAKGILRAAGVKPQVHGLEKLPERTFVLVSNHQSHFDPPLIFASTPRHLRFVAKAELFRIPVLGAAMKRTGNIKVDRTGSERDRQTLAEAAREVREKVSVVFFPEGTRSPDGELRRFKKGAAMMAIRAQVPVVPMAIAGTKEILQRGSAWIHGGRGVVLIFGEPIPTDGLTDDDRDALTERMREAVEALLGQAEAKLEGRME